MGITLFVTFTLLGFVTVDYQGRRLSFGDDVPPFHVTDRPGGGKELAVRLLGLDETWDVTELDKIFDFLCDFGCIPHN